MVNRRDRCGIKAKFLLGRYTMLDHDFYIIVHVSVDFVPRRNGQPMEFQGWDHKFSVARMSRPLCAVHENHLEPCSGPRTRVPLK